MVSHFVYTHRCLIEKNVPIALILPSRWQDGAESLGIEHKLFMNIHEGRNEVETSMGFTHPDNVIRSSKELI